MIQTRRFTQDPLNTRFPSTFPRLPVRLVPGTYSRGQILAEVNTTTATAVAGSNTGNGTFATPTYTIATCPGAYAIVFTAATAYTVTAPDGTLLGAGAAGTAFTGAVGSRFEGLSITFTAGGTPMIAGDTFTVTIPGTGYFKEYSATKVANPVLAAVPSDTGTGTFAIGIYTIRYTYITPAGESLPGAPVSYSNAGSKKIRIAAITSIPNYVTYVRVYITGSGVAKYKDIAVSSNATAQTDIDVSDTTNVTAGPPTVSTAYIANDGTSVAKGILPYSVKVASDGSMALSTSDTANEHGGDTASVAIHIAGTFDYADLVGFNSDLVGTFLRFIKGDATNTTGAIVSLL